MRGHRFRGGRGSPRSGSIPACAGAPETSQSSSTPGKVYPRVCGGTVVSDLEEWSARGLSPRVRGHPLWFVSPVVLRWSIPACAGAPESPQRPFPLCPVYPRVCGGTLEPDEEAYKASGLSPRVRGHQPYNPTKQRRTRSIPACAGAPIWPTCMPSIMKVYPRVCGGTMIESASRVNWTGLSPRVRGHRWRLSRASP